ncbi:MAG: glycosyl hydrolase 2 galactose-binding domain-containing protein [Blautia marasmi]
METFCGQAGWRTLLQDNEMQALALMEHDFVYRTTFDAQDDILNSNKVCLRCEGLDTLAELYLNRKFAGRGENMHRTYDSP